MAHGVVTARSMGAKGITLDKLMPERSTNRALRERWEAERLGLVSELEIEEGDAEEEMMTEGAGVEEIIDWEKLSPAEMTAIGMRMLNTQCAEIDRGEHREAEERFWQYGAGAEHLAWLRGD